MFSSNVTKPAELGPVPEDVKEKSHHVKNKHGETVKFQNPHPSFTTPRLIDIFKLVW
jgi:N-acyl-phosphatidylethanolamine-hydrolysing phospholipase D